MAVFSRLTPTGWVMLKDSPTISLPTPNGWIFNTGVSVQLLRPASDISTGSWLTSSGTDYYALIDETNPVDSDYVYDLGTATSVEVKFGSGSDPSSSSGHVIRYRARNSGAGSLTAYLYQGATLKATHTPVLTDYYQTFIWTLSGAEADSITDYSDLRIRFTSS